MKNIIKKIQNNVGVALQGDPKAITLTSLVITIIILLIVVGIVIYLSLGENNIISKAIEAKQKYEIAEEKEKLDTKIAEIQVTKNGQATLNDVIEALREDKSLNYYIAENKIASITTIGTISDSPTELYIICRKKYQFKIEKNLETVFVSVINENQIKDTIENKGEGGTISVLPSKLEFTEDVTTFDYTGSYQEFIAGESTYYKIECWGAGAYNDRHSDAIGYGAYTSGIIYLNKNEKIYIYVGGHPTYWTSGGYNGGGYTLNPYSNNNGAGGGATDIRLTSGVWNNFDSLKSRIMVAGGGGAACHPVTVLGHAGTLTSKLSYYDSYKLDCDFGAGQTSGYAFGIGGSGNRTGSGGGYYGGVNDGSRGSGGSSYISGHIGCDSIAENSTEDNIIHTGKMIHYSGKYFLYTSMESGYSYMPTFDGTSEMVGNTTNGYAKITRMIFEK